MTRFDDYHRTVTGYHGTGLSAALRLVNRVEPFRSSERDYDWLGRGVYFWEYAPKQALAFASIRQRQLRRKKQKSVDEQRRATEPLAVVACTIRLGFCLDLTEPATVEYIGSVYTDYTETMTEAGEPLPQNTRKYRKLDCQVFEYAYKLLEETGPTSKVDTARGIYVPTGGDKRVWEGSWISRDTHIQICVRNLSSLLGVWLHHPTKLEVKDACEALQAGDIQSHPQSPQGQSDSENASKGEKN
jgi:hypothetical protein